MLTTKSGWYKYGNVILLKLKYYPTVDASKAGSGNIEIMINDGEIACSVQNHGNYKFTASFMPASTEFHRIEMKFNSAQVPGNVFKNHISLIMHKTFFFFEISQVPFCSQKINLWMTENNLFLDTQTP